MTKKITLTILIIAALLVAIYKWIMSSDEEQQKVEETETATSEKEENVNGKVEEATTGNKVNENHK